ncbi:MAG: conserved repeat protein, partial [Pedosphaera sp.]|nr:conserved repeat protein [Pedosphaera sp.]
AIPTNFTSQTLPETVAANVVSTLNFGIGQPPAHLLVTETSAPNPVVVGSNLVYLITLNNSGADAQNVQLTDRLAPTLTFVNASITNPPGGSFTSPVFSNGVITTTGTNLASDQSLFLVVTVVPTVPGLLTNITTVTSTTPDTDPTGTNLTAMVVNTATAPIVPQADLALTMTVLPNPVVVSNQLAYSLFLTNLGPADAPGVVLDTVLPAFTTFLSASNSQGTFTQNGTALHWDIGTIANQGGAQAGFVIMPLTARSITNFATVAIGAQGGGVTDPNPANNSASAVVTVTAPVLLNVSVQALGNPVFNPQTGLFEQTVQFHNLSTNTATGVRVSILGLPAKVTLYNASGSANGVPYVEYDLSVVAGGTVNFALEYYDITRTSFVSTNFTATAVEATTPTSPPGTVLQLDQMPVLHKGQLLIEFASIPGKTYVIQYSSNMLAGSCQTAVPPIVAAGTKVQGKDAGPPKTASPPGNVGQRFYQVLQIGGTSTNLP